MEMSMFDEFGTNLFWIDVVRYIVIAHGSLFVILVGVMIGNLFTEVKYGYRPKESIKFEIANILSYLTAIIYMTYTVIKQLHHDFLWYITPIVFLCLIFGDFALYYRFHHRHDNKE